MPSWIAIRESGIFDEFWIAFFLLLLGGHEVEGLLTLLIPTSHQITKLGWKRWKIRHVLTSDMFLGCHSNLLDLDLKLYEWRNIIFGIICRNSMNNYVEATFHTHYIEKIHKQNNLSTQWIVPKLMLNILKNYLAKSSSVICKCSWLLLSKSYTCTRKMSPDFWYGKCLLALKGENFRWLFVR